MPRALQHRAEQHFGSNVIQIGRLHLHAHLTKIVVDGDFEMWTFHQSHEAKESAIR